MCTVDRAIGQKLHWWLPRAEEEGGLKTNWGELLTDTGLGVGGDENLHLGYISAKLLNKIVILIAM